MDRSGSGDFQEDSAEKWAMLAQKGRPEAFEKLYGQFFKKIYFYLYYRCLHRETAEDLTSAVFLKALEKLSTFRPEAGNFSAWIYGIARNALMDFYRRRKKTVDIEDVWDISDGKNLELDAENSLLWERLKPYFAKLSGTEREIVLLRVWDDVPYREISRWMGKSEASCKMIFRRAMDYLREAMPLNLFLAFLFYKILH